MTHLRRRKSKHPVITPFWPVALAIVGVWLWDRHWGSDRLTYHGCICRVKVQRACVIKTCTKSNTRWIHCTQSIPVQHTMSIRLFFSLSLLITLACLLGHLVCWFLFAYWIARLNVHSHEKDRLWLICFQPTEHMNRMTSTVSLYSETFKKKMYSQNSLHRRFLFGSKFVECRDKQL